MASMHRCHEHSCDDLLSLNQDLIHSEAPIRERLNHLRDKELIRLLQNMPICNVLDKSGYRLPSFVPSCSYKHLLFRYGLD